MLTIVYRAKYTTFSEHHTDDHPTTTTVPDNQGTTESNNPTGLIFSAIFFLVFALHYLGKQ